jgi:M6 family metalloprotease-like protein
MQDAVTEWDPVVDFSVYDLFYVVSPVGATGIASSPAFIASEGDGVTAFEPGGPVELRHGSTLAQDRTLWKYQILAHETGHVFGLPDLYEYDVAANWHQYVGGWDTMGRVNGPAPDYLAYHKRKLEWLADNQIVCMTNHGWLQQTLTPLHTTGGVKAVMVAIDTNRVVVVENRDSGSPIDGQTMEAEACYQEGVLVYVVDARVGGGGVGPPGTPDVMPVTVVDANPGSLPGCTDGDVAAKSNATMTDEWDWVQTHGVFVQISDISGANRQVQVSW